MMSSVAKTNHSRGRARGIDGPQRMREVQVAVLQRHEAVTGAEIARLGVAEAWGRNVRSGWADPQGWRQLKMEAAAGTRGEDGGAWAEG
jgi:hypothetical protein